MKNVINKLFIVLILIQFATNAFAQKTNVGIDFIDNPTWDSVLTLANEKDKLIFIDCYTSWCGPCKRLASDIFVRKEVGDFFNTNFINVKYDMEKGEGELINKKFAKDIPAYPTMLLVNKNGEVIHKLVGFQEADDLISGIKNGMTGKTIFALNQRYDAGERSFDFLQQYVPALEKVYDSNRVETVMKEYLSTIPVDSLLSPQIWALVKKHIDNPYSKEYKFVLDNLDHLQFKLNEDRHELERRLNRFMSLAISQIILTTQETQNQDTLKMMSDNVEYLQRIVKTNLIKGFPENKITLALYKYRVDNNLKKVIETLTIFDELNLIYHDSFYAELQRYIITNSKDKKLIDNCLKNVSKMHNPKGNILFQSNYHDILSLAYSKLGDKEKAKEENKLYLELKKKKEDALFKRTDENKK